MANLTVTVGVLNFTNWLHVTASKVSNPISITWETWLPIPIVNNSFVIPNVDPENYYIRYYDALTNVALGTLQLELLVNGATGKTISERRFYTVGGAGPYDPIVGATGITDPFLIGKTVSGVFKESFRYLELATEYTFDDTTGDVDTTTGSTFADGEKFIVEVTYSVGQSAGNTPIGLYTGTITVTTSTRTLLTGELNNRVRLVPAGATQAIQLPPLSSFSAENGYYFDHTGSGIVARQAKILTSGADRIRFNGFGSASDLFAEFWVSQSEHLLLKKYDAATWEVFLDYKGSNVGERLAAGYNAHPNTVPEDGRLMNGDEYPRLFWWVTNVLPLTHRHYPAGQFVTDPLFNWDDFEVKTRVGQFMVDPTLGSKWFRMPNTQKLSERGLLSFANVLADPSRLYNYAGGVQEEMVGPHKHKQKLKGNGTAHSYNFPAITDNESNDKGFGWTEVNDGTEQRVKNIGVIFCRRI